MEHDDKMNSLLNLDEPKEPAAPPAEPEGGAGTPKPADVEKRVSDLEESNKNLQEALRQSAERNKKLSTFHDKIVGNTDEEKKKKEHQELTKKLDEDAVTTIQGIIAEQMGGVKSELDLEKKTNTAFRVMQSLDKNFIIDWNKDHQKIEDQLKTFAQDAKDKDPEGTILAACRLAGVIKPRDKATPPPVAAQGKGGGTPAAPGDKTEEDELNKRLNGYSTTKKDNVFGISEKKENKK